jgi:serine/tyrosine/threonine adenylyltransferase
MRNGNSMMVQKIGLNSTEKVDLDLVHDLLNWMQQNQLDYTNTFLTLMGEVQTDDRHEDSFFSNWLSKRADRLEARGITQNEAKARMAQVNPLLIPRNHYVEQVLDEAALKGNYKPFTELLDYLKTPYKRQAGIELYQHNPENSDLGYQTFCGT